LIITSILITASFIILIFSGSMWSFYLFAVIFGFAYGADVPLVPLMVEKYFGTKSMATLMGLVMFVGNTGGALGPWLAGKIFDVTQTYHWVFIIGAVASALSLIPVLVLKNRSQRVS
jgi:MFS family permease